MSETAAAFPALSGDLPTSSLELSALLASRLCHDLVNPVGALAAGLDVLDQEQDPEMQAEARKLIALSTEKAIVMLDFARLAFGAGGAYGAELDGQEIRKVVTNIYRHFKADLDWQMPTAPMAKDAAKAVLNAALVIADCVPRLGSNVTISQAGQDIILTGTGPRAKLKEELASALAGQSDGLSPKMTPAYLAALIMAERGGRIDAQLVDEETVRLVLRFA